MTTKSLNSRSKRNKPIFSVQVVPPTDTNNNNNNNTSSSSPPPPSKTAHSHSSGLDIPGTSTNTFFRSRYMTMMISPRSSNYERLEGGMGPSRILSKSGNRFFGWRKFGIVAVVIILLVYLFGPRERRWKSLEEGGLGYTHGDDIEPPQPKPSTELKPIPPKETTGKPTHPISYETDPDPTKTIYCTTPHSPTTPLVQYALMIDAGSTGSRIHIYKFNNCGPSAEFEYEVFKMTQPGLSSYAGEPEEAAGSLDVLFEEANRVVPASMRGCTPVAVKATAGLRLLPDSQSAGILHAVEERIDHSYAFKLVEKGVVIMDGTDEGVYAWITANYLLGTIKGDTPKDTSTYAVLDLGGASTQIVFEPTFSSSDQTLEPGEHKYDLKFAGRNHVLYQHSYLGYGLSRARMHVHSLVDFMASIRDTPPSAKEKSQGVVGNPCLARGTRKVVKFYDKERVVVRNVTMDGDEIGSFEACDRIVQLVMAKDAICEVKPCSFNGVYQPSLLDSFPNGKVLLLSYFYDRLAPLLPANVNTLTVSNIANTARDICGGRNVWLTKHWGSDANIMKELAERPEWCLDVTFLHALLRLGYEFGDDRQVNIAKKVGGTELGWCLGATIAMVGGELSCRE